MNEKILIIDDEDDIRSMIQGILEDEGYTVNTAATSDRALSMIHEQSFDLVIQDIWLQGSDKDGIEILKAIKSTQPHVPFLMISGHGTIETAVSAIKYGAYDFIEKPFKSDRLLLMISRALENATLRKQNKDLKIKTKQNIETLTKQLPDHIIEVLDKSADTKSRLMITGEAGCGKNIAAHYVHEKSPRSNKPFMVLNCATTHPERLEKELFGVHTTSTQDPPTQGLLQLVDGGTLLLDEVSALPLDIQGKLLSFLQDNQYYKIGSNKNMVSDIRIIATSSINLEEKIENGDFRKDLFYRLNVVPIHIPALRDRKNEISSLIQNATKAQFTENALIKLKTYSWPGNLKQFNNALEWINIMHADKQGREIDLEDLPQEITGLSGKNVEASNTNMPMLDDSILTMQLREARECFERYYLLTQVNRFDGNISKTAEFIGMERSALHRKLKSLEVFADEKQNVA